MPSHFITLDSGLTLHAVEYGGEGPPLLLVHGTGLVAQVWGVLVPFLMPHFRVYALDRKGHGESDKPAEGYELESAVDEYRSVIERLGGEGWQAIGHSSGGTSLGIATVRHPALLRGLVMLDPIVFPPRRAEPAAFTDANSFAERTRTRRESWPSARAMFDDLASKRSYRTWQPEALWDYVRHGAETGEDGAVRLKCPPALEAQMYGASGDLDLFAEFAAIPTRTLIIRGAETDRFPRDSAERVAASNPAITLVELPETTHFPSMEKPANVARLCVEFLG